LIKYWGKQDTRLNLPDVGSISITLDKLFTDTSIEFDSSLEKDYLILNEKPASVSETERISRFLDLVRTRASTASKARIESKNNFPTSAGLASSASAFAALALAATHAAGLDFSAQELSELARQGSGSAARSVFGGFAEMQKGAHPDGSDATAYQIVDKDYWDIRVLIIITSEEKKKIGSTEGMTHTRNTSSYYGAWVDSAPEDLDGMRNAIIDKDFEKLGDLSEYSCLKMHALALSSRPGLIYWNSTTLELMHRIRSLRDNDLYVYFTIDAGPQVKALCLPDQMEEIKNKLQNVPGVLRIIETKLGDGAKITGE
jgi:diphosphomevalonate decarboxylase